MGYEVWDGDEVATVWENFDALTSDPGHPSRSQLDTFYLDDDTVLRTHTSPDQIRAMQQRDAADLHDLARPLSTAATRRTPRTRRPSCRSSARRRPRDHARRPAGNGAAVLPRALRRRSARCACARASSRSPSRRWSSTSPASSAAARAARRASTRAGSRWAAPAGSTRDVFRNVDLDPDEWQGFAFGLGIERIAHAPARPARPARVLGERPARAGAVLMKVPVSWLREYVDFDLPLEELARAARLHELRGRPDRAARACPAATATSSTSVVGSVLEAGQASERRQAAADEGRRRARASRARSSAAPGTSAPARRWRSSLPGGVMPGGEFTIEKRKLRGEVSDGMILSERELELGQDHGGIMLLADELAAGHAAGRRAAARRGRARDRDAVQPARSDVDLRDRARGRGADRRRAEADAGHDGPGRARRTTSASTSRSTTSTRCPRFIARPLRATCTIGESPAWLKARLLGAGMRPISNVVDITNYVMLALGSPLHAFDYDDARRRTHRRAPRAARRAARHARRHRAASSIPTIS